MTRNVISTLAALALAGASLFAQQASPNRAATVNPSTQSTARRHMSDRTFARIAARSNMAEVKLGQLAESNGSSNAVKDFAKKMVQDHSANTDQLKSAASQANITLPSAPTAPQRAAYDRLSKLSGAAFDRTYARDMVRDHRHDLALFRGEARDGQNDAIKNYASQTVPTLEEHLKLARQMDREVVGTTGRRHATGASSSSGSQ